MMHEPMFEEVEIGKRVLDANERFAQHNREFFAKRNLFVVNLMGSPGSGKTSLLEKTIPALRGFRIGVIEGDIEGDVDKKRVESAGAYVSVQINTHGACHLLAHQIEHSIGDIDISAIDLLFIENVGNLVCPAEFDLGESMRVMVLGVTEGADKPLKYPLMFRRCEVLVLNKIDLAELSGCDIEALKSNVRKINPDIGIIEVSCRTGAGLDKWLGYLASKMGKSRGASEKRQE